MHHISGVKKNYTVKTVKINLDGNALQGQKAKHTVQKEKA